MDLLNTNQTGALSRALQAYLGQDLGGATLRLLIALAGFSVVCGTVFWLIGR